MKNEQALFGKQWIDIVFDKRNTAYGAYQLRLNYERNMAVAMMLVVSAFIVSFLSIKLFQHFFSKAAEPIVETVIKIKKIPILKIEIPKPINTTPTAAKLPVDNRIKSYKIKEQVADVSPKDTFINDNMLAYNDHGATSGTDIGVPSGTGGEGAATGVVEPPKAIEPPTIPYIVEEMPSFPGGEKALFSFIQKHLDYPDRERELGIEGKAVISFVIAANGKVTDVKTLRADSKGFSKASENVIGLLPNFKPGKQAGKEVSVRMTIPIQFKTE